MAKMIGVIAPGGMTFESLFAAPCPWYAPGVAERAEYLIKQYMAHEGFTFVDAENENFSASECIAIIHWSRINKELLYKVPKVLHIYLAHEPHLSRTYNLKAGMDQLSRVLDYILSIYVDAANEQKGIYVTPGYYNFDVRFSPAINRPSICWRLSVGIRMQSFRKNCIQHGEKLSTGLKKIIRICSDFTEVDGQKNTNDTKRTEARQNANLLAFPRLPFLCVLKMYATNKGILQRSCLMG